jgi:hypothetical protein
MKEMLVYCGLLGALLVMTGCQAVSYPPTGAGPEDLARPATVEGFAAYGKSLLTAMIAITDGIVENELRTLDLLAATREVKSGKWDTMRGTLTLAQKSFNMGVFWYARPDGSYYTVEKGLVDQSLADRDYFPKLMAGETVIGSLVISKSTGKKSAVVAVPVMDGANVIGAVGVSIFLEELNKTVAGGLSLPDGMLFYALAPDGTTTLNKNAKFIFADVRKHDSPSLKAAADEMLFMNSGEASYEWAGFKRRVLFQESSLTGWRFAVGMNVALAERGK